MVYLFFLQGSAHSCIQEKWDCSESQVKHSSYMYAITSKFTLYTLHKHVSFHELNIGRAPQLEKFG